MTLSRRIKRNIREKKTGSRVPEATRRRRFRRAQYDRGLETAAVRLLERLAFRDLRLPRRSV